MQNLETNMTTRTIGEAQGYEPLHIHDCKHSDGVNINPAMLTLWQPSLDDLERLNAGEPLHLIIMGVKHPPVIVGVGRLLKDTAN